MKTIIYILSVVFLLTSCSKDFLEIDPEGDFNAENFYKTEGEFNAALTGAYAKLQGQIDIYFELTEYRSDYLDFAAPTAGTQDRFDITKFQDNSANVLIRDAWANYMNGLLRCNVITDNLPAANLSESFKKQIEGEARFIRALTYFNMVRLWGDVPIILKQVTPQESLTLGRSPISEVYKVIENDLLFAKDNLKLTNNGRATSGAAKALLGKVYLTQKKYPEAITVLSELIGKYSLQPNIADVFDTTKKQNSELIFSIQFYKGISTEDHGLWLSVSDVTTTPFTQKLLNAYQLAPVIDARKAMVDYRLGGTKNNIFVPGKFYDTPVNTTNNNFGNDYTILRYADVLLMLSEALNEESYQPAGSAFDYLNDVRTRSKLTPLTPTNLPDQASFRDAVLYERFLEFPFEGQRWFDLIRTNTATKEIKSGKGINILPYQLLYPVPQTEIQKINNPSIFYQNEGYN